MTKTNKVHLPGSLEDPYAMHTDVFTERGKKRRDSSAERQEKRHTTKYLTELSLGAVAAGFLVVGILDANERVYGHHRAPAEPTPVNRFDHRTPISGNTFVDSSGNIRKTTSTGDYESYKASAR
jgi:hypothetical protein